jgi:hypothetical protein
MDSDQLLNLPRFGIHEKVILQACEIDRLLLVCSCFGTGGESGFDDETARS